MTAPTAHHRRRKTFQDWITTVGGIVAILGSAAVTVGWAYDKLPFERAEKMQQLEEVTRQLNGGLR